MVAKTSRRMDEILDIQTHEKEAIESSEARSKKNQLPTQTRYRQTSTNKHSYVTFHHQGYRKVCDAKSSDFISGNDGNSYKENLTSSYMNRSIRRGRTRHHGFGNVGIMDSRH